MEAPVTSAYQRLPVTHVLTDTRSCTLWDLCCRSPGLQCHHCFSFPQLCCHISAPLLVLTTWNSPPLDSRLDSLCLCWQIPFLPVSFLRKFPLKLLLRGGFVLTHSLTRSLSRLRRRPSCSHCGGTSLSWSGSDPPFLRDLPGSECSLNSLISHSLCSSSYGILFFLCCQSYNDLWPPPDRLHTCTVSPVWRWKFCPAETFYALFPFLHSCALWPPVCFCLKWYMEGKFHFSHISKQTYSKAMGYLRRRGFCMRV